MWDYETDVLIVGYGGAGGAAALAATEAGARVLLVEKNNEGGGNTRYSGGSIRTYTDLAKAIDFIEAVCEGTTERSVVETFVQESDRNKEWVAKLGGEIVPGPPSGTKGFPIGLPGAAFPTIRGAEGIGPRVRVKGAGEAAGIDLWGVLQRNVDGRKIPVLYSCSGKQLIYDKSHGVTGLIALKGDAEIKIRARRGIVLTCGGFEYNVPMHMNYLGQSYFGLCNPGNTGDGIRMAAEIGADLWHMSAVAATWGYKFPEFPCAIRHFMPYPGFVYVDQSGKRFMDETGIDVHAMWAPSSYIDMKTLRRTRVPAYVIFDEDTRTRGAVARTDRGRISDIYQWSADNSAEIRKGWIKAAQTIADLAPLIQLRPDQLQATIAQYNLLTVSGYDPEFGRSPHTLAPIAMPPFYAIPIWPCLYNTQGGPKRNAKAQVLDFNGRPIKRLYSAGELGSLWYRNYPGGGNVSEALAFGRIAGKNAAAEAPDENS
ncbi:MAG TPA: FAD-dependent oxidoreductase [candidate division Zixibacteria bacterium]|nr:FAD-dependent oxidoreductase [candidate division Zixibacteria bacterium]